jgi:dUTP pyrophosphatase
MNVVLDEGAIMPVKAHETDAGFDIFARYTFIVPECSHHLLVRDLGFAYPPKAETSVGYAVHDTGVHIEIPQGYVGFLKSKSGLNVNHSITSEGVIDSGYTGSIVVKLYNHSSVPYTIEKGDKISQLVILPISDVNELTLVDTLNETDRGDNGFGSTGK